MDATMNITKSSTTTAVPRTARRLANALPASIPRGLFAAALLERRLPHVAHDEFPGTTPPAKLSELGEPVLVRADRTADEVEALLLLPGGAFALIDTGYGDVSVEVAGPTRRVVDAALATLRRALASPPPQTGVVSVAFWLRADSRWRCSSSPDRRRRRFRQWRIQLSDRRP